MAAEAVVPASPLTIEQPAVPGGWLTLALRNGRRPTAMVNDIYVAQASGD